ncbi:expressed unknown protein [Seminavis robusta]|uniref:Uncharacterized protein n=1 Tax=Seminavis robusta TaxID=568900 RepID=A0A9N8HEG5_9STRA|nr:expressed unknown protein [Seminavis robusta]|eukprot:Sro302_g112330.1 n/a (267) ;mRNA; f:73842-74642
MKVFNIFKSKYTTAVLSGKQKNLDVSSSLTEASDGSDRPHGKPSKQKKRHSSKRSSSKSNNKVDNNKIKEHDQKEGRTANEKVIDALLAGWNGTPTIEENLSHFASPDVVIKFEDMPSITARIMAVEMDKCYKSFPNLHFHYESVKEVRPGHVLVEDLQVSGTHTGEPFAFAHFPAIPTSNKHLVNDHERLWFTVNKEGKIVLQEAIALGSVTGIAGFYMQLGGKMDMPPPPPTQTRKQSGGLRKIKQSKRWRSVLVAAWLALLSS